MAKGQIPEKQNMGSIGHLSGRDGLELAEFIQRVSARDLSEAVQHAARRQTLEALSWMLLGSRWDDSRNLYSYLECIGATQIGNASVVALPRGFSPADAAFAKAALCQIHDCNYGYKWPAVMGASPHPGRAVIPAALALAENSGATVEEFFTLVVLGYEVAARMRGRSPAPPADAYAVAAIASRVLKLGAVETLEAMGLAGHLSSPRPSLEAGDTNYLTNGQLVRTAIEAASLAQVGMIGPGLRDDPVFSTRFARRGLGKKYHIEDVYIKPYPTCRMIHGAIDAALSFRDAHLSAIKDISGIRVRITSFGDYVVSPVAPDSAYKTCQFSLPYCIACALLDGNVGEAQFSRERIAAPDVQSLQSIIQVKTDRSLDALYREKRRPTIVEFILRNGESHLVEVLYEKGEAENPLTDIELCEKFEKWGGPSLPSNACSELTNYLLREKNLSFSLEQISRLLRGAKR